jgi:hypothetical protein
MTIRLSKVLLLLVVFLLGSFFTLAEVLDVGEGFGLESGKIFGDGIEFSGGIVSFISEGGYLNLSGNVFENIVSQDEAGHPTFIKLDSEGNILEADFSVNEEGGNFLVNGVDFDVPANSRVFFNEGILELQENTKINSISQEAIISGENIFLPKDYLMESGILNFDSEGNSWIDFDSLKEDDYNLYYDKAAIINGIRISNPSGESGKKASLFFDSDDESLDGIYFFKQEFKLEGEDVLRESFVAKTDSENSLDFVFDKSNPYFNIEDMDHFAIKLERDSEISILNRDIIDKIPRVSAKGHFVISDGNKRIYNVFDEVYLDKVEEGIFSTTPIDFRFGEQRVIVDNKNRVAMGFPNDLEQSAVFLDEGSLKLFSERLNFNYRDENYVKNNWGNIKLKDNQFVIQTREENEFFRLYGENINSQKVLLEKALRKKYPGIDFNQIKKGAESVDNSDLNGYLGGLNLRDVFLEDDEVKDALGEEGYRNFLGSIRYIDDILLNYAEVPPTFGETEGNIPLNEQLIGPRVLLRKYYTPVDEKTGKPIYYYYFE